jgi:hypothetical protein
VFLIINIFSVLKLNRIKGEDLYTNLYKIILNKLKLFIIITILILLIYIYLRYTINSCNLELLEDIEKNMLIIENYKNKIKDSSRFKFGADIIIIMHKILTYLL